mmetsp:Transcript_30763/g.80542  ORF Transcript_30763/g.80542 Transcript_30763/m.80542 type:complete len:242 (-) Transcript_30763:611-1336(-)
MHEQLLSTKRFPEAGGGIASHEAEQKVHSNGEREEYTSVGGREEAKKGKRKDNESHAQKLAASADKHRKKSSPDRWAEHIAEHELPSTFFSDFLTHLILIVPVDVSPQHPDDDHRNHTSEEDHHQQRVDNREPVDVIVSHLKVQIPPRRPLGLRFLENNIVREDNFKVLLVFRNLKGSRLIKAVRIDGSRNGGGVIGASVEFAVTNAPFRRPFLIVGVFDTAWLNFKADDIDAVFIGIRTQ